MLLLETLSSVGRCLEEELLVLTLFGKKEACSEWVLPLQAAEIYNFFFVESFLFSSLLQLP